MKKLILIFMITFLSGCDSFVYVEEVNKALELCKDHQGLNYLRSTTAAGRGATWSKTMYATCKDEITLSITVKGNY